MPTNTTIMVLLTISLGGLAFACNRMDERATAKETKSPGEQRPMGEQAKQAPTQEIRGNLAANGAQASATEVFEDPGARNPQPVTRAVAVIEPTQGHHASGTVTFDAQSGGGLKVKAQVHGLPEGKHAYHLHLYGDCSGPDGKTAGTHFNLSGSSKNPPAGIDRITGNLGELVAGPDGRAEATATLEHGSIEGQYGILGRSVIVHEKGNDPSKPPMGAAGARLGCGVIGIAASAVQQHASR